MEEEMPDTSISDEGENNAPGNRNEASSGYLGGMSDSEIQEHLEMCMRLSAENKINVKNAFGLHLIGIMRRLVKDKTDLQFASLGLQASTKIYAGRVEALYKETCQFHGHLQTIVSGGKKASNVETSDLPEGAEFDQDGAQNRKSSQKNKFKSYLTTEESITIQSQASNLIQPHENFNLMKTAFSATRTAKKLLNYLQFESDGCEIRCAHSSKCFKPKKPLTSSKLCLAKKVKGHLEKLKKFTAKSDDFETGSSPINAAGGWTPYKSPPQFSSNSDVFTNEDSMVIGNDVDSEIGETGGPVDVMAERFNILDITAHSFAQDVSRAVTHGGTSVDQHLLPPQSALKKLLKTSERSRLSKTVVERKKREPKPYVPFFGTERVIEKSSFMKGKKTILSDSAIAEWALSDTTVLGTGHEEFSAELAAHTESDDVALFEKNSLQTAFNIINEKEAHFALRNSFHKRSQPWKRCRQGQRTVTNTPGKVRPSSMGAFRDAELDVNEGRFGEDDNLVQSFHHLSLNDSGDHGEPGGEGDGYMDPFSPAPIATAAFLDDVGGRSTFEDDIQRMMVAPPELVKPIHVKYQQKPLSINTEKVKDALWSIVSTNLNQDNKDSVLLSEVYKQLQKKLGSEDSKNLSLQFTFVMLLCLANEKTLLIENIPDSSDLVIKKDVLDIDSTTEY